MQINNISNCHKPKSFKGLKETGKVRYKHYEQMSDRALSAYSLAKAYCEVKDSKKSRLLKAMPAIATTLIATSLAITQPGKLATKASKGVGFLMLVSGMNFISDKISKFAFKRLQKKNENQDNEKTVSNKLLAGSLGTLGAVGGILAGALAYTKGKDILNGSGNKIVNFLKSEGQKLKDELNYSKLGMEVEEKFIPFMNKHFNAFRKAHYLAPVGLIVGSSLASHGLRNSISDDISKKAVKNFIKGKAAQKDARAHFDTIDAIEV